MATTEAVIEHDAEWDELEIGPMLRRLRGRMGLREAHRISSVSASMLSQIENGSKRPGPRTLRKLATLYAVAVRDLLARAGHVDDGQRDPDNGPLATGDVERVYQFMLGRPQTEDRREAEGAGLGGGQALLRPHVRAVHRQEPSRVM